MPTVLAIRPAVTSLLILLAACAGAGPVLQGQRWQLAELPGAQADPEGPPPQKPELLFGADGRLSGSGGCNRLQGSYQLSTGEPGRLKFGRLVSTLRACLGGMAQEQQLLQALDRVAGYELRGQELRLLDAESKLLVRFEAIER